MKMRKSWLSLISILAVVMVLLLAGCSESAPKTDDKTADDSSVVSEEVPVEPVAEVPVPEETVTAPSSEYTVRVLGKEGFDNSELNINVGDTVVFKNDDSAKKVMVLTFQLGNTRKIVNSESVMAGEDYSMTFGEAGTYNYWNQAYGIRAKIVVQ